MLDLHPIKTHHISSDKTVLSQTSLTDNFYTDPVHRNKPAGYIVCFDSLFSDGNFVAIFKAIRIMKPILLFCLIIVFTIDVSMASVNNNTGAPVTGNITGTVIDQQTQKPVEYANVVLYNTKDSSMVNGTVTTPEGTFQLQKVKEGNYYLIVYFIGYKKKIISDVNLTKDKRDVTLSQIQVEPSVTQLNEVSVTADRLDVEYKIDKKVVNVGQNLNTTGGTAVDALKNVPGVNVDNEGNVSIRGSSSFTVLIDGRPSFLGSSEALKQIPASSIDKIEVITNPSAKYDAEGTSGIVNVLLKKGGNSGLSGVVNASSGYNDKYSGDFLFNLKKDKFNSFAGMNYRNTANFQYINTYKESYQKKDTTDYLYSMRSARMVYQLTSGRAGFDYNLTTNDIISVSFNVGELHYGGTARSKYHLWTQPGNNDYIYINNHSEVNGTFFSANTGYQKKFKTPGHELNALLFFSYWQGQRTEDNDDYQSTSEWEPVSNPESRNHRLRDENKVEVKVKLDYVLPLDSTGKIEAGYQTHLKPIASSQMVEYYNPLNQSWQEDLASRDKLKFHANIHAAYATLTKSFGRTEVQAGLRGEYTDQLLDQQAMNKKYSYQPFDWFPTFAVSRQFEGGSQLQASYSRRINRPNEFLLNPLPMFSDRYTYNCGNPELLPEFIDSYQLNYMKRFGFGFCSVETYFRKHNNTFTQMLHSTPDGYFYIDFGNIDKTYYSGVDISGSIDIKKWFSMSPSVSLFGYHYESGNITYNVPNWPVSMNARSNFTFRINPTTRLQVNAFVSAPYYDVQGWQDWFYTAGISARKDFKKVLTATININNPFDIYLYKSENKLPDLYNKFMIWAESPVAIVSVSYKINNYKPVQRREETMDLNMN